MSLTLNKSKDILPQKKLLTGGGEYFLEYINISDNVIPGEQCKVKTCLFEMFCSLILF